MILKSKKILVESFVLIEYLCSENNFYYFKSELYENDMLTDSSYTMALTDSIKRAKNIYNILVDNQVFPCHLHYIIDEMM
jgi:hypothetical protein